MNKKELVEKEIIDFHLRIENWFKGNIEDKEKGLAQTINAFHPQFSMSGAGGSSFNYNEFSDWLPKAFGLFIDKQVLVTDIKITVTDKHGLAEYIEIQTADGVTTKRRSSAVFIFTDVGAQWFHLLEEWI